MPLGMRHVPEHWYRTWALTTPIRGYGSFKAAIGYYLVDITLLELLQVLVVAVK